MDAFEARLAVRIVAMDAHAGDGLRLAGLAVDDPLEVRRCRAQAASMARQSDSALRTLLRMPSVGGGGVGEEGIGGHGTMVPVAETSRRWSLVRMTSMLVQCSNRVSSELCAADLVDMLGVDPARRHAFVHVLEGQIVMHLKGQPRRGAAEG